MMASRAWMGETPPINSTYRVVTKNCHNCNQLIEEKTITYKGPRLPSIDMIDDFNTAKNAIIELLREVDEFKPELYHMHQFEPGDDSIEDSIKAICQALINQEWYSSINTQELEAHHVLTHDGNEILSQYWISMIY